MSPKQQVTRAAITGLVLLIVSLFGTFKLTPILHEATQHSHWPSTVATIIKSSIIHSPRRTHSLAIRYTYNVSGTNYESENYDTFGHYSGPDMTSLAANFQAGQKIIIYHSPDNPAKAVIFRGLGFNHYALLSFLIASWFFTILLLHRALTPIPRRHRR